MRKRTRSREFALQILYQLDMQKLLDGDDKSHTSANPKWAARVSAAFDDYWASFEAVAADDKAFAERLVRGVAAELHTIDEAIATASRRWKIARMDKVDRNVLRLAAYELLRCPDIPRAASINEAIEIAKRFSGQDSAAFINGILDQLGRDAGREDDGEVVAAGNDGDDGDGDGDGSDSNSDSDGDEQDRDLSKHDHNEDEPTREA